MKDEDVLGAVFALYQATEKNLEEAKRERKAIERDMERFRAEMIDTKGEMLKSAENAIKELTGVFKTSMVDHIRHTFKEVNTQFSTNTRAAIEYLGQIRERSLTVTALSWFSGVVAVWLLGFLFLDFRIMTTTDGVSVLAVGFMPFWG